MARNTLQMITAAFIFISVVSIVSADVPRLISYQGRLTDSEGNPLDTAVSITFTIYTDSVDGETVWFETHPSVEVNGGLFDILLGSLEPVHDSTFKIAPLWLGIQVGSNPESEPRAQIVSVAYAHQSLRADTASSAVSVLPSSIGSAEIANGSIMFDDIAQNGAAEDQIMKWNGTAWDLANDQSTEFSLPYIGVDTLEGGAAFGIVNRGTGGVSGSFKIDNVDNSSDCLKGETNGSGRGVYGRGTGPYGSINYGYLGGDSVGVFGKHGASGNFGYFGGSLYGAFALNEGSGNFGYLGSYERSVYGEHGNSGNYGYLGGSSAAVYGSSPGSGTSGYIAGNEYGVQGHVNGGSLKAIYGSHQFGNYGYLGGSQYGVYGYANGVDRVGMYASYYFDLNYAFLASSNYGLYSYVSNDEQGTCAVRAVNVGGGYGVYATSNTTETEAAVYAQADDGGYAVKASGETLLDGITRIQDTLIVAIIKSTAGTVTIPNTVIIDGDLSVSGAMWTGFPRPDWESGWFHLAQNGEATLIHNLGGDPKDYFVDLQIMDDYSGTLMNKYVGGFEETEWITQRSFYRGANYKSLSNSSITVHRLRDDQLVDSLRVRIWVIR